MGARVSGLNHITLAVADVERSTAFYRDILGYVVRAAWTEGAYLEAGQLWLCLSRDDNVRTSPHPDYCHFAFSVPDVNYALVKRRIMTECVIWGESRSEGLSTYFIDRGGHKPDLHAGTIETRLAHYKNDPSSNVRIIDKHPQ